MTRSTDIEDHYDVVVVGARPAGAGTALLLARQGARVLLIDRGRYGSDTLSTHALMRAGVMQLQRWGVLPRIAAATPRVTRATLVYGGEALAVDVKPRDGIDALYAPRSTVLDRAIVDAAVAAGVQVAYGSRAVDLCRDASGRVTGLTVVDTGTTFTPFGQAVIAIFIQLGGLGIIIFGSMLAVMVGTQLSLRESLHLSEALNNQPLRRITGQ